MDLLDHILDYTPIYRRFLFETTDAKTGQLYSRRRFWTRASVMHCLDFHRQLRNIHERSSIHFYGLEHTVHDLKTSEMFK